MPDVCWSRNRHGSQPLSRSADEAGATGEGAAGPGPTEEPDLLGKL